MFDNIIILLILVLVIVVLIFIVIGFIMRIVGDWMIVGVMWLFFDLGLLGGVIYGIVYLLLVIIGMYYSFVIVEI